MTLARFFSTLKLAPSDAEVIFDCDEPVGRPTDIVMPRRRWFRAKKHGSDPRTAAVSRFGKRSARR